MKITGGTKSYWTRGRNSDFLITRLCFFKLACNRFRLTSTLPLCAFGLLKISLMTSYVFDWIDCDGGPLLLLPEKHLVAWEGATQPSEGRIVEANSRYSVGSQATDYDRACDVEDLLGLIDVGEGQGVVFGDEPLSTTWVPSATEDGGMFVRWVYAENETDLMQFVTNVPGKFFKDTHISISVENTDLILFAACEASNDKIYPRLKVNLPSGRYAFSTAEVSDAKTSVICHRLRKVG